MEREQSLNLSHNLVLTDRIMMSNVQIKMMKSVFENYKTPTMPECQSLANYLGLAKRDVQEWFQSARTKETKARVYLRQVTGVKPDLPAAPIVCKWCSLKYPENFAVKEHILQINHLDKVKIAIEEGLYEPESPGELTPAQLGAVLQKVGVTQFILRHGHHSQLAQAWPYKLAAACGILSQEQQPSCENHQTNVLVKCEQKIESSYNESDDVDKKNFMDMNEKLEKLAAACSILSNCENQQTNIEPSPSLVKCEDKDLDDTEKNNFLDLHDKIENHQTFSPKIELEDMNEKLQPGNIHNFLDLQLMKVDKEEISDQSENNDLDAMIRGVFEDIDEASEDHTGAGTVCHSDAQANHDQGYPDPNCQQWQQSGNITGHVRKIHHQNPSEVMYTGEKPHPCRLCGWIFSRNCEKLEHEMQCPAMHAPGLGQQMWRPWSSALS